MAAMTMALESYQNIGNTRKYLRAGHTTLRPRTLVQRRVESEDPVGSCKVSFSIVNATVDGEGNRIPNLVAADLSFRVPNNMGPTETDVASVKADLIDLVSSDEFAAALVDLGWVKA